MLLIILLSLAPLLSLFTNTDMIHTHDGPVHLARIAEYYKSLADGQILPRWAGNLNFGYGTPVFIFLYPLPYLIGSLFLFLGANLILAFKLVLTTSYLLSGVTMYFCMKFLTKNNFTAYLSALLYQFAPYRLVELVVRGSMAEAFVFSFLPLMILGASRLNIRMRYTDFLLTGISCALLVLSHNSMSLVFVAIALGFLFYFSSSVASFLRIAAAFISGLLLSAFYWIPALLEHRFTYGDLFMRDMYKSHFAPFFQFIIPNVANNSLLQTGGISVDIGIIHTALIVFTIILLARKPTMALIQKKILVFALAVIGVAFFFMLPLSAFFWEKIPLLRQFQFPWRFLAACAFGTSLLAIALPRVKNLHTYARAALTAAIVLPTLVYWYPPLGFDRIDVNYYWNYPLNTTYFGESDSIWAAGPASSYPKNRIEIASGNGTIKNFYRRSTIQTFTVSANGAVEVVSHTQYFPGWKAFIDGLKAPIEFQNQNWRGLILFSVPSGTHEVKIEFTRSGARVVGDSLSAVAVIFLIIGACVTNRRPPNII